MKTIYKKYLKEISSFIDKDRIYTDELHCIAWGTDASCYRETPQIVVRSKDEQEVSLLLRIASKYKLPVTFRAAGTALSGQSVSNSILIVAGKNWEKYQLDPDALSIKLQPGIIGARVNKILKPYNRCFGPDPASINSCMVGGIVVNNASGMSCGTHANSDKELISARIVFADGTILDTANEKSRTEFAQKHSDILQSIEQLRDEIANNHELSEKIRFKYSIKNVTGLNINPFINQHDPFDIIAHLMVGSEGTLAFLSEVTMKTLPLMKYKASAMIYFNDIKTAAEAVVAMKNQNVTASELLDKRSLLSVDDYTGDTAILTETQANSEEELQQNINGIKESLANFQTATPIHFTSNPAEYSKYWAIRAGIFPSVGGMREEGTTCIIEDVAFHIEDLPQATIDLSNLLDKHGYSDSCIYGHALEGNFHFIINQSFDTQEQIERYDAMIQDVAQLVVEKYNGSLKAEHGTGRNMAPFVEYEWGEDAYNIMKRVKAIFDPLNILNPGVIFNDNEKCYLHNLKTIPSLQPQENSDTDCFKKINKCIECGFCEVNCMSCGFTLSSRTRIVINREIERRKRSGESFKKLIKEYKYYGEETCAGDGLCSMSCPMGINVGDFTHEIRRQNQSNCSRNLWNFVSKNFNGVKNIIRCILKMAKLGQNILGNYIMSKVCTLLHSISKIPLWTPSTPMSYKYTGKNTIGDGDLTVVYLPSCLNQMMGTSQKTSNLRPLIEETIDLLQKANCKIIIPENKEELCCGTIWESKGMPDIADKKLKELEQALLIASNNGEYPILCDQSPCLHRMRTNIKNLKLYEPTEFIWTYLRERLIWEKTTTPISIHTTCSMKLMKLDTMLYDLASLCSSNVLVPEGVGCCGFAGDRGMTHPELNKWGTRKLREQIEQMNIKVGYSNSRTCEIGLEHNSGIPYISIVYLVNQSTQRK